MVDLAGAAIALGWNQLPPFLINAEIGEAMVDVLNVEKGVTRDSQEQVRETHWGKRYLYLTKTFGP